MIADVGTVRRRALPALSTATIAALAVVGATLVGAYAPSFRMLVIQWWEETNYSHGFLVIPIAGLILWQRKDGLTKVGPLAPVWLGWVALMGILLARVLLFERNEQWIEAATIPLAVAALVLAFGGWRLLAWAAPAIAFLWFMMPLPPSINMILAGPLQRFATTASTIALQAMGLPVVAEGNVIIVGSARLEVARACNGLSMLLSFATLITAATIFMSDRPLWERVTLMISIIPIALVANILRIMATAWCYHLFGRHFGDTIAHTTAGLAMMPIALVLVWIEIKLLRWLVIEEDTPIGPTMFIPPVAPPRPIKKPPLPGTADHGA